MSNVTNMSDLFRRARSFNQPIGAWDTGNVIHMTNMFGFADSFNQDIVNWDVSNVVFMSAMLKPSLSCGL